MTRPSPENLLVSLRKASLALDLQRDGATSVLPEHFVFTDGELTWSLEPIAEGDDAMRDALAADQADENVFVIIPHEGPGYSWLGRVMTDPPSVDPTPVSSDDSPDGHE